MWKKFNFFTAELLQSTDPGSPLFAIQALDISCVTSGQGYIVFGDSEGGITLSDQEFSLRRFLAYDTTVNHTYQYKSSNILLTIGDGLDSRGKEAKEISHTLAMRFRKNLHSNEDYNWMLEDLHIKGSMEDTFPTKNATLKLWLMDKMDENGTPLCLRTFKLFEKVEEEIITTLAVNEKSNTIALGCQSGSVYLIQGDLSRSKRLNLSVLPSQFNSPITNLHFSEQLSVCLKYYTDQSIPLFVTTAGQVGCYTLPGESRRAVEFMLLDEVAGCRDRCACVNHKGYLVGCNEWSILNNICFLSECELPTYFLISSYSPSSLVTSYLLGGTKSCLFAYRDCLVVSRQGEDTKWIVNVLNVENTCDEYELPVLR